MVGVNRCSICLREPYCSCKCQKEDWKSHKCICKTLKKLSLKLQPYQEVKRVFDETIAARPEKLQLDRRVLVHLISYGEHQLGDRVPGKNCRERSNGDRMDNYQVEIALLGMTYNRLVNVNKDDQSLGEIGCGNLNLSLYERLHDLLSPWWVEQESGWTIKQGEINHPVLYLLSITEMGMASIHSIRDDFSMAEGYCKQALSHARLYKGTEEDCTQLVCQALSMYSDLRIRQGSYDDALLFAEEAYNLLAIAYNPVHPKVQEGAGKLIECLNFKNDYSKAELYAQMTLDSLKDPANKVNQESGEVAKGYFDLGNVIHKADGDLVKAEMLVRESYRIRIGLRGGDRVDIDVGHSCDLLGSILASQGKLDNETMELFERSSAVNIKNYGLDGTNTANSIVNFGMFYQLLAGKQQNTEKRLEYLRLSKSKYDEAIRIYIKNFGLNSPQTMMASRRSSNISCLMSVA
jgi:hypothetical protein